MIRIAVCDDNQTVLSEVEAILLREDVKIECDLFSSGRNLLRYIEKTGERYPIYLLDISMPRFNGIDTAREIRRQDRDCLILFLTEYEEFVYQVFDVLPFRFLRKPVKEDVFLQALQQAISHLRAMGNFFFFQIERESYQIPYSHILYFEGQGRKVKLATEKEEYLFYGRMKVVKESLDSRIFMQPHGSYLVNMEQIHSICETNIVLRDGQRIPVSRRRWQQVKEQHLEFMKWRCGTWK